ncbi:CvpA family protein [Lachnoanaerobaculum umeaense]|jgi:colicin V production protein|uniref:CvpA family protein n=1 Tax=Lachnoanaerobaculum umeaense TaxID=617123 RepID=A0A385PYV0_9FIRM|nr:CvpA family protein [Lachnoanaerobaculum umeaense]AYA98564.1 CvpA family protein [Lachnoanaerobaculum umeaense]PZW97832.1 colicin V production protein [Lachnoanaerobaculum umeaense]
MVFNFFEILVFLLLVLLIAYGYKNGLLKLSITMLALLSSVIVLNVVNPYLRNQLQENTKINQFVLTTIYSKIGLADMHEDSSNKEGRNNAIDKLNVPTKVKDVLKRDDDRVIYEKLGVYTFSDYIASYVTQMTVNAMSFMGSFILVWLVLGILFKGNKLLSKLPILGGMNQIFGAIAGLTIGLIIYWVVCIFIIAFSTTKLGSSLSAMVESSPFLVFLSRINPIATFLGL